MQTFISRLVFLALVAGMPGIGNAANLLPSAPAVSIAQAQAGNIRLVAWELPNGTGIEVRALNAVTQEPLSTRVMLGSDTDGATVQMSPAVAGLADENGDSVFLVAWHAEILNEDNISLGTEIVGQRVTVSAAGTVDMDALMRISRVDDDTKSSAASETDSAPIVVANGKETEFLVLWTHWPEGQTLSGDPLKSPEPYFIYGQEITRDGTLVGGTSVKLDRKQASDIGKAERVAFKPIFLAATPKINEPGYLLAWSDPAQENLGSNLAQLYSKFLPAQLSDTADDARIEIGDSSSAAEGTGRIDLAPLPDGSGYLLAFEDKRGLSPLSGFLLNIHGVSQSAEPVTLLDAMATGDGTFLSPRLVSLPEQDRLVLYAVVGNHSIGGSAADLEHAHLVRRVLDPQSMAFDRFDDDFETVADYPAVNIRLAAQAYAAGTLAGGAGDVSFSAVPGASEIAVNVHTFDAPPPPPPPPPPGSSDEQNGGGALLALLMMLPWLRRAPIRRGAR